jgi:hypothetical protein
LPLGRAPDQRLQKQRIGTRSLGRERPHAMYARLQELRFCRALLSRPRRTPQLLPPLYSPQPVWSLQTAVACSFFAASTALLPFLKRRNQNPAITSLRHVWRER